MGLKASSRQCIGEYDVGEATGECAQFDGWVDRETVVGLIDCVRTGGRTGCGSNDGAHPKGPGQGGGCVGGIRDDEYTNYVHMQGLP